MKTQDRDRSPYYSSNLSNTDTTSYSQTKASHRSNSSISSNFERVVSRLKINETDGTTETRYERVPNNPSREDYFSYSSRISDPQINRYNNNNFNSFPSRSDDSHAISSRSGLLDNSEVNVDDLYDSNRNVSGSLPTRALDNVKAGEFVSSKDFSHTLPPLRQSRLSTKSHSKSMESAAESSSSQANHQESPYPLGPVKRNTTITVNTRYGFV